MQKMHFCHFYCLNDKEKKYVSSDGWKKKDFLCLMFPSYMLCLHFKIVPVKQIMKKYKNLATLLILMLKAINLMDDEHNKHYYYINMKNIWFLSWKHK